MYSFSELKTNIATILQRSGDAAYVTKIGQWVNFGLDFAYRSYDYYAELEDEFNFSTADAQESYYLPPSFGIPLRIYDLTNGKKLTMITRESYFDANISSIFNADEGRPDKAMLYGISPVMRDIAATGITLKAKSSSISDASNQVIRIEGYIDSSHLILDYEDITINSSSPTSYATASSPKTFYKVTHITCSSDTTGYITIADSAGNVMAQIAPTQRASRYPVLKLGKIPDDTYSMRTLFKRTIQKLVNDNDYPFIDSDEFLISYGVAYGLSEEKEQVERAQQLFSRAESLLMMVIRAEQTRLGEDFQHKMVFKHSQAHRT